MNHSPIRTGDQYQCHHCGKAWDVDDPDPPPCKEHKARELYEKFIKSKMGVIPKRTT